MKIIVGLGNPGKKYDRTKHNMGFLVIDELLEEFNETLNKNDFDAKYCRFKYEGEDIFLVKPLTYMNDSGRAVGQLMGYFQIQADELLVVQDDMDMPIGKLRLRQKGSAGGHNGIKSIINALGGNKEFKRVKIGIQHPDKKSVVDWVLTPFSKDDEPVAMAGVDKATNAIIDWIKNDNFEKIMNQYN
ncbi:peptidyl-tRNA hydrolase [Companilactobacillus sp. RD055328]|uniref:aminoacyl-tRNA hydrolase n=1 Tax=Companilactobacillus sp. RD055328 TaxID=2916634 RepID=UPI001FC8CA91|nr:aminoacyl-tRNA hydrolase [Companilactobacillus sp. RD055328]GKQ42290.1 peptidyl-tRNA hydrolase [Companilactobacillus sp. RD055328]